MHKPHLSPSAISRYLMCPEAYRRGKEEKTPPPLVAVVGTGVHAGAAENLIQKIDTARDLPASDIRDAAVATYDEKIDSGFWRVTDHGTPEKLAVSDGRDSTARLADVWAALAAPNYRPKFVECKVTIATNGARDIVGWIDLIDVDGLVVDWKTSGRAKRAEEANASIQLTTYAAGYQKAFGKPPSACRLDVFVDKKTPERQVFDTSRGPAHFAVLARIANAVGSAIDAGNYPPAATAATGAWPCSTCWYRHDCRYLSPAIYSIGGATNAKGKAGAKKKARKRRSKRADNK